MKWLGSKVIKLDEKVEEALKKNITKSFSSFPRGTAINLCGDLVQEDKSQQSDVYLWWGGEPNTRPCYAFLTLYFEIDPEDIGTSRFDEKVSRNLRTIINIAEKGHGWLSFRREYEPIVWRAVFFILDDPRLPSWIWNHC